MPYILKQQSKKNKTREKKEKERNHGRSACSCVTLAGKNLVGGVCGGETRTTANELRYGGLQEDGRLGPCSMERRVGRREEERSVGNVACGIHRRPSGRWWRPFIMKALCHKCRRRVWYSAGKGESILGRQHL